jgi:hypothetical protein
MIARFFGSIAAGALIGLILVGRQHAAARIHPLDLPYAIGAHLIIGLMAGTMVGISWCIVTAARRARRYDRSNDPSRSVREAR